MKFKSAPAIPENGRLKTITTGTSEVFKLDPRYLSREPGFNTRYDFGDIAALAADIEANGVLEALKVRKEGNKVFVVNGDRRLTAIELLIKENRWPEDPARKGFPMPVPCTSEGKGISPTDRVFMMLSLNTGKPFTLLEKGYAYTRILDDTAQGVTAVEIARRTGETKQAVSQAVTLVRKASPKLISLIKDNRLSATLAYDIAKSCADHAAQNEAADAAIAAAATNGRHHATAKDLPKKPAKPGDDETPDSAWAYTAWKDHGWNEHGVATTANTLIATNPRLGITITLLAALDPEDDTWRSSYNYESSKGSHRSAGAFPSSNDNDYEDEASALQGAWENLAPSLLAIANENLPLRRAALLAYFTALGNSLHAQFVTGQDHNDSLFDPESDPSDKSDPSDSAPPFIADLSDEDDPSDPSDSSNNPDAPADPSAFERLKNAPNTNRDGSLSSGPGGSGGTGFATSDKRLKNIEELLDSMDPTVVNQDRWDTVEMIVDYLNGNHTVAMIRKHLTADADAEAEA